MKTKRKVLLALTCAVLLVVGSVMGTFAYMTDRAEVTNTFTIGKVAIKLDEARTDEYGQKLNKAGNVWQTSQGEANLADRITTGNNYKLIPGSSYVKDPTVTVASGSEPSYVKMTVTLNMCSALGEVFGEETADWLTIFQDMGTNWQLKTTTVDLEADTCTYEYWYKAIVDGRNGAVKLPALFSGIKAPSTLDQDDLAKLYVETPVAGSDEVSVKQFTITVKAYAIQAAGFTNAAHAWANFT